MLKVTCQKCGKEAKVPPELQGKRVACPRCGGSFRVPAPSDDEFGEVLGTPDAPSELPVATPVHVAPPPVNRPAQAAKFIADEATESRVQLGADGRLPGLQFENQVAEQDVETPQSRGSNPLMLIGMLCFGITLSVILLVVDPQQMQSDDAAKAEAREALAQYYTGLGPTLKPYEKCLREALQAHSREDYATERRRYREVLNMLHDESIRGAAGLTGPRKATEPPCDQHLEQQIATLLLGE
jgi:DNA-directed RNA polymerase subunit RPC12/RpoP